MYKTNMTFSRYLADNKQWSMATRREYWRHKVQMSLWKLSWRENSWLLILYFVWQVHVLIIHCICISRWSSLEVWLGFQSLLLFIQPSFSCRDTRVKLIQLNILPSAWLPPSPDLNSHDSKQIWLSASVLSSLQWTQAEGFWVLLSVSPPNNRFVITLQCKWRTVITNSTDINRRTTTLMMSTNGSDWTHGHTISRIRQLPLSRN